MITNPGTGYTSAPSVTLTAVGGSGASLGTVSIATNATTGGLTFTGSGTTTLSGASTYGGVTNVNSGTLRVANGSSGSATGSGSVRIAGGAFLSGPTTGQGSIGGVLNLASGASGYAYYGANLALNGGLTYVSGAATAFNVSGTPLGAGASPMVALSGAVDATGGPVLTINAAGMPQAGTYDLINYSGVTSVAGSVLPQFALGTTPGGAFEYALSQTTASLSNPELDLIVVSNSLAWTGVNSDGATLNAKWTTSSADTNWAGGSGPSASPYLNGAAVTFGDTNPITGNPVSNTSGTATVTIQAGGVSPASITFTNVGAANGDGGVDYSIGGGAINGNTTGITLNRTGNVTLTAANGFMGAVAINAGQLILQNNSALGSSSGVTVAAGGALALQNGVGIGAIPLYLNGAGLSANPAVR